LTKSKMTLLKMTKSKMTKRKIIFLKVTKSKMTLQNDPPKNDLK